MTQATTWSVPLVGPATPTVMATRMNDSLNAVLTNHSGSARPSYFTGGGIWLDTTTATAWALKLYDGTDDLTIATFNPSTNAVAFPALTSVYAPISHTHTTAQVTGLDTALAGKAPTVHTHDDRYYTESEIDASRPTFTYLTGNYYTSASVNSLLGGYLPLTGGSMSGGITLNSASLNVVGGTITGAIAGNPAGSFNRSDSSGNVVLLLRVGTQVGSISVAPGATAYNTSSDARIKENITPLDDVGDIIDEIEPVTFSIIGDDTHTEYMGFIAQELVQHVPNAVFLGAPEEVQPDDPDFYPHGVDLSRLVPLLVKEIQSLRSRVAALEAST